MSTDRDPRLPPPLKGTNFDDPYSAHIQKTLDNSYLAFHPEGYQAAMAPTQRYGNGPGQQPYFTPGAFRAFRAAIWTLIFGPIMVRIGKNWYERTGDWQLALGKAMLLSAMWKVWGTAVVWWMAVNYCLNNPDTNWFTALSDGSPNNPTVIAYCRIMQTFVVTPALAVAYCKLVDKCFFKHRFAYKVIAPIHKMTRRIPWVVLISTVLLPIFFYIQMTVVQTPG